jgi:hypothetical protein
VIGAFVGFIWMVILSIRAVKETQQVSDGAALAIVLIPAAIIVVLVVIVVVVIGIGLLGFAAAANS